MIFTFYSPEDLSVQNIPSPSDILRQTPWFLELSNAPYLAGATCKPDHSVTELNVSELRRRYFPQPKRDRPMNGLEINVVGDISDTLDESSKVILAKSTNFVEAEETAKMMGYRPATAGEYLQMLLYLDRKGQSNYGWYYCYHGRVHNYAILSHFSLTGRIEEIIFDTHIDDLSFMNKNMDTLCFFVK